MRNEQTGIVGASPLNALGILPETSKMKMLIAGATLTPRVCAIIGGVGRDVATIDRHIVRKGCLLVVCTRRLLRDDDVREVDNGIPREAKSLSFDASSAKLAQLFTEQSIRG